MAEQILFYIFGSVAVAAGIGVIMHKNAVMSALFLVISFFCLAGLYLIQDAQFIAALQIIVYAGAIMVLIIFVIMLLNLSPEKIEANKNAFQRTAGFTLGGVTLALLLAVAVNGQASLKLGEFSAEAVAKAGSSETIGLAMFTSYVYPFEIISLVLLSAIVGAIVLAKRKL